jgi:chemosensory pili system protein ChpE
MLALLLGVALSFGQCLAVGPVNAEALRRGLRGGFRAALAVELGSCLGDGLWAALAFLGLGALFTIPLMDAAGSALGVLLLGYLAVQGWREAAPISAEPSQVVAESGRLPAFWAGMVLSVVNPGSAAFWVGVGATVLASHLPVVGPTTLLQFAAGYYAALVAWSFGFAALAWQMGLRLPTATQLWIQRAVALLLGALAGLSLYGLARRYVGTASG